MSVTTAWPAREEEPRTSAAARSRAVTRARLLDSGKELFAEQGLHGVTTHDIAHGAGVASGTFYLHFKDKSALFRELATSTVAELRERIRRATDESTGLRDGVRARVEAIVDFAEENRDLIRIIFSGDVGAADVESDILDDLAAQVAKGRSESVARGEMPAEIDPAVLSQALVGMVARAVLWWVEDPSRASRETLIETLTRIQLSGTHPA